MEPTVEATVELVGMRESSLSMTLKLAILVCLAAAEAVVAYIFIMVAQAAMPNFQLIIKQLPFLAM
ncbi:MAG: hypothetical protein LIP23_06055 [Planctomycetes bacterium]|nr:hypothetical protein [Planctomycetota bacterium]